MLKHSIPAKRPGVTLSSSKSTRCAVSFALLAYLILFCGMTLSSEATSDPQNCQRLMPSDSGRPLCSTAQLLLPRSNTVPPVATFSPEHDPGAVGWAVCRRPASACSPLTALKAALSVGVFLLRVNGLPHLRFSLWTSESSRRPRGGIRNCPLMLRCGAPSGRSRFALSLTWG